MNPETSASNDNTSVTTIDRNELISGVIEKHQNFLNQYQQEFRELDEKIKSLNEQIDTAKKNKQSVIERRDVLREKRQQMLYQAQKSLKDLLSSMNANSEYKGVLNTVDENISKLKTSIPPEEEKQIVGEIINNISEVSSGDQTIIKKLSDIKSKIDSVIETSNEIESIKDSDKQYDEEYNNLNRELNNLNPRYKWLEKRIISHGEGLEYWKNANNNQE